MPIRVHRARLTHSTGYASRRRRHKFESCRALQKLDARLFLTTDNDQTNQGGHPGGEALLAPDSGVASRTADFIQIPSPPVWPDIDGCCGWLPGQWNFMTLCFDKTLGAWFDDSNWVPAPRYLLRRARVLDVFRPLPRGELIEVGCGAGALLYELNQLGYNCRAVESSPQARDVAARFGEEFPLDLRESIPDDWRESANVVLSMEVLEHIEDDEAAVRQWSDLLKPGGALVLAVPCHMSKWGKRDEWAGHFRRYEKAGLVEMLESAGLQVERFETYGFPLANLTLIVNQYVQRSDRKMSVAERTARSGVERDVETSLFPFMSSWPGKFLLAVSCYVQKWFLSLPWGDGYLVVARRPAAGAGQGS